MGEQPRHLTVVERIRPFSFIDNRDLGDEQPEFDGELHDLPTLPTTLRPPAFEVLGEVFEMEEAVRVPMVGVKPKRAHSDDAAFDLRADAASVLRPGETKLIACDVSMAIPDGYVGLVCSRSGLASAGVFVINAPGVIDAGYRGKLGALLHHTGVGTFYINPHDRIAQLLILKLPLVQFEETDVLPGSNRGSNGFGSTGR